MQEPDFNLVRKYILRAIKYSRNGQYDRMQFEALEKMYVELSCNDRPYMTDCPRLCPFLKQSEHNHMKLCSIHNAYIRMDWPQLYMLLVEAYAQLSEDLEEV